MNDEGEVSTQIEGHTLLIEVDRSAKMNGFTPTMFEGIENALFELARQEELWVGIIAFKGEHTTAGLDLPKFSVQMLSQLKIRADTPTFLRSEKSAASR